MTKKLLLLAALIALICLASCPVHAIAQTITFSNPGAIAERDVLVYDHNGTLWGTYNTTSTITLDGNGSYVFVLKPTVSNPLDDPGDWLTNYVFPFVQSNAIALLCLGAILGIIFGRGRR